MTLGARIPEEGDREYMKHNWELFENGDQPVDGSCVYPILDAEGKSCWIG